MLEIGGLIGFAQPWVLAALLALPGLWWLLRLIPPPPRRQAFPAIALLAGLLAREESAARMPWWLLALRLLLAALVILALADPVLAPQQRLQGNGPVVIVVDNSWASATNWPARQRALADILDEADRQEQPVMLLPTAMQATAEDAASVQSATVARSTAGALNPQPWPTDREALLQSIEPLVSPAEAVWLSDGLETPGRQAMAERLQRLGRLTVFVPDQPPLLLAEPETTGRGLRVSTRRATAIGPRSAQVQAIAADGRVLAATTLTFADGEAHAATEWTLPRDLINQVERLRLAGQAGAGGTVLLDDRWQRRLVGLVDAGGDRAGHPLLDPAHYLRAAFTDIATFQHGSLDTLLEASPSILVMRERLQPAPGLAATIETWLAKGGLLLRFASPGLAEKPDAWLPVRLRPASRTLGGALSWETPQGLAPFPEHSPFWGLSIPTDVTVNRQVLAEPAPDLRDKTWASLADGTPLVTAKKRGDGWIVLVHVSPDADWSSLPLSGLFLQMLDRLVRLGHGEAAVTTGDQQLPPQRVLDGFGHLQDPEPQVRALPPRPTPATAPLGPQHPPGFYGAQQSRFAWNLAPALGDNGLAPIAEWPSGVTVQSYGERRSQDISAWLLLTALVLLLADTVASLALRGHLRLRGGMTTVFLAALASLQALSPAPADAADDQALQATFETHLAYVVTGDDSVDRISAAGLAGLSHILAARTSIEPATPVAVQIETTELAFFPLLYWPIVPSQPDLSPAARERVSAFLEHGGTILFDTRDLDAGGPNGPGSIRLQSLLKGVRIPPLQPIRPDHVLTRAFYLLSDFPGRWEGAPLWVESGASASRDGVTSVLIGRHDWAAAWAMDADWRPIYPVYPGGQRQREFAYRFGVNLVMHVLTGNYKGDQVHIPDILKRLGQ